MIGNETASTEAPDAPRANGTPTLCLMARDPHTLFAYWDIDWTAAFRDGQPGDRKVHLRVRNGDASERSIEVEPMAGSCYVSVERADADYNAEIGFYQPPSVWHAVATSNLISTPPDDFADSKESEFATVPFHLSFQQMIDALRSARGEDAPLIAKLADLRQRAASSQPNDLTPQEGEVARAIHEAEVVAPTAAVSRHAASDLWNRQRLERILGFGATSPSGGFGGSSRG